MIWNYSGNGYPQTFCKCEVLMKRHDGNLQVFFCEYDPMLGAFLLPQITDEMSEQFEAVHYWRAL